MRCSRESPMLLREVFLILFALRPLRSHSHAKPKARRRRMPGMTARAIRHSPEWLTRGTGFCRCRICVLAAGTQRRRRLAPTRPMDFSTLERGCRRARVAATRPCSLGVQAAAIGVQYRALVRVSGPHAAVRSCGRVAFVPLPPPGEMHGRTIQPRHQSAGVAREFGRQGQQVPDECAHAPAAMVCG